jgi:hypothetical protein
MLKSLVAALIFAFAIAAPTHAQAPTPLFAGEEIIRLSITGPIAKIAAGGEQAREPRAATLTVTGSAETHPIRLSARGITRMKRNICQFPPLRVDFASAPPANSLFAGQRRLKLVTHCRPAAGFQQHLLLEYAAYKLYNELTPASFRVRLASIDYVGDGGRPITSRLGFFIEDHAHVAARNGMQRAAVGASINVAQLSARDAGRLALFEYMIGNLDWSIRAGPAGDECCHNSRLIGAGSALVPVPYDFDFSGLVDASYAAVPAGIDLPSVRSRHYWGYCAHNGAALAAAAEFRAKRAALLGVISAIPQLEARTRAKATAYLESFFADIATDQKVQSKVLRTCRYRYRAVGTWVEGAPEADAAEGAGEAAGVPVGAGAAPSSGSKSLM